MSPLPHPMSQPGMPPATAALYDRVTGLYTTRSVTQAERKAIQHAMGTDRDSVTFDSLPSQVQQLVLAIEARPQVGGWASPRDVPPRDDAGPAAPAPDRSPYMTIEQAAPRSPRR